MGMGGTQWGAGIPCHPSWSRGPSSVPGGAGSVPTCEGLPRPVSAPHRSAGTPWSRDTAQSQAGGGPRMEMRGLPHGWHCRAGGRQDTWLGWSDPGCPLPQLPGGDRSPTHTPVQPCSSPTALLWHRHGAVPHPCPHVLPTWAVPCPTVPQAPCSCQPPAWGCPWSPSCTADLVKHCGGNSTHHLGLRHR